MPEILTVESPCRMEVECPDNVLPPGAGRLALLKYLFSVRGKSVLDLGCGSGLFAIAAAKLGAREVWATDLSPAAVDCTRRNAERNRVELRTRVGDFLEPVGGYLFDLIVALPPAGQEAGGFLGRLARSAPDHLEAGGQLLTFLPSTDDSQTFESVLNERFRFRRLPEEEGSPSAKIRPYLAMRR